MLHGHGVSRHKLRLMVLTACAALFVTSPVLAQGASPVSAQTEARAPAAVAVAPWFGLPLPGPATEQVVDYSNLDLPMIPAPLVRGAPELNGQKVHKYVDDVVKFSYASRDAGERTWGRLAGSRWAEMTVDYVAGQFREAGLTGIVKHDVPFRGAEAVATDWKLLVIGAPEFGAGSNDVELKSAFPMASRGEGASAPVGASGAPQISTASVRAKVAYLGGGTAADIATTDMRGKIAIVRMEPAPGMFYSSAIRIPQQLVNAGAVGVIVIYDTPGNLQVHFGSCAQAPCFVIGGEDGDFLTTVIARAAKANALDKLELSLSRTETARSGLVGYMLVGKVAGKSSAENLIVSAHSDAYFAGANDNASGVAGLIALARQYAKGPKPSHDIYFVLSPGHHSPTGATRRIVELYPKLAPANIVTINLEHIGQQGTYRSYFNANGMGAATSKYGTSSNVYVPTNWDSPGREISGAPLTPVVKRVLADAARRAQFTGPARITGGAVAELAPIVAAGATGIQDVETSIWYHTSGDTAATVAPETLERALLFYKDILDQMDKLSRAEVRAGVKQ